MWPSLYHNPRKSLLVPLENRIFSCENGDDDGQRCLSVVLILRAGTGVFSFVSLPGIATKSNQDGQKMGQSPVVGIAGATDGSDAQLGPTRFF
jgi:hypothetical protein